MVAVSLVYWSERLMNRLNQNFILTIFPNSEPRAKALGIMTLISTTVSVIAPTLYGYMFSLSGKYSSNSFGRQAATMLSGSVAICGMIVAYHQQQVTSMKGRSIGTGQDESRNGVVSAEEVSEETRLLE